MAVFWALFKTLRPRQWLKNVALFAALVFSGFLFLPGYLATVVYAAIVFTMISSSVYILNDPLDLEVDRKHPFKHKRPLASGQLPVPVAIFSFFFLLLAGLALAYGLSFFFFGVCLTYWLISGFLYTFWLKKIPIIDVLVIATGYILRVYAGAVAVNLHMSVWFLLTVVSMSLFLAVGKRRSEMTLLQGAQVRATLKRYTSQLLDIYTAMFATASWLTYALFTFNEPPIRFDGGVLHLMAFLPRTFLSEKLLMATVPLMVYGVMRYLQLIYERNEGESPERVILSDKPLIISVLTYGLMVIGLLYLS